MIPGGWSRGWPPPNVGQGAPCALIQFGSGPQLATAARKSRTGVLKRSARIENDKASKKGRKAWSDARLFLENSTVCQVVDAKMVHRSDVVGLG